MLLSTERVERLTCVGWIRSVVDEVFLLESIESVPERALVKARFLHQALLRELALGLKDPDDKLRTWWEVIDPVSEFLFRHRSHLGRS